MKRMLLIALVMLIGHTAHAQSFGMTIGGRLEAVPNVYTQDATVFFAPTLGFEYALEFRSQPFTVGARVAISSLLLLYWHVQADLYVGYTLGDGLMPYGGIGYSIKAAVVGAVNEDIHALLGVRWPSGFFLEVTPGLGFASVCVPNNQPMNMGPYCAEYKNVHP